MSEKQLSQLQENIYVMILECLQEAKESADIDQPFLKQNKAAAYIGISVNTLKKLERKGLPSIRFDGLKLYSKEEMKRWLITNKD